MRGFKLDLIQDIFLPCAGIVAIRSVHKVYFAIFEVYILNIHVCIVKFTSF